jgi:hypothetical protein
MSIEVQWSDLKVATRVALKSEDPSGIDLGAPSMAEVIAIARGEIVVAGAPADVRLPRSVAGHAERRPTAERATRPGVNVAPVPSRSAEAPAMPKLGDIEITWSDDDQPTIWPRGR